MTLSAIYKEKILAANFIDPIYFNGWISLWQFIFSIPLCIPAAYASGQDVWHIPAMLKNGWLCYLGINPSQSKGVKKDDCASAPIYVNVYLAFNIGYNIFIMLILKFGSADLLFLSMAAIVPFASIVFSLPFVPGNKSPTLWGGLGLFFIIIGLLFYRFPLLFQTIWKKTFRRTTTEIQAVIAEEPLDSTPLTSQHTRNKTYCSFSSQSL
jgi:hypothetical protein